MQRVLHCVVCNQCGVESDYIAVTVNGGQGGVSFGKTNWTLIILCQLFLFSFLSLWHVYFIFLALKKRHPTQLFCHFTCLNHFFVEFSFWDCSLEVFEKITTNINFVRKFTNKMCFLQHYFKILVFLCHLLSSFTLYRKTVSEIQQFLTFFSVKSTL